MRAVTYLFVPAHESRKVERAVVSGADAVILDLEDGVPPAEKTRARAAIAEIVERTAAGPGAPELWVRVNGRSPEFEADVQAMPWRALYGVVLPKAEDPRAVADLDAAGARRIMLLIESAAGLRGLPQLVEASTRVDCCGIGLIDFALDLGLIAVDDPDTAELSWHLRADLVVSSRALRLEPPVDAVSARLDDESGLKEICDRAARMGFCGKMLIHPKQIAVAQAAFGISEDRLRLAREIVEADERASSEGRGASRLHGQMVDRPVVERAKALLQRANRQKT